MVCFILAFSFVSTFVHTLQGRVQVDGKVVWQNCLVTPHQHIKVDALKVAKPDRPRLWLYNKPAGQIVTHDASAFNDIFSHIRSRYPDLENQHIMSVVRTLVGHTAAMSFGGILVELVFVFY